MGTSKVNSSRKTVLQREWDIKINVTMPAGHTLPLTFAFDFMASYFCISSMVPEPEPVIFKRFWLRFRPQPSGSTGSGSASLTQTTLIMLRLATHTHDVPVFSSPAFSTHANLVLRFPVLPFPPPYFSRSHIFHPRIFQRPH